jgi:hypothetical protein
MATKSKSSICLALFAGIALMGGFVRPQKTHRITSGVWGGEHIHLEVNSNSGKVEFDCAHGTIEGPLAIDANGEFNWKGRFARERGGPVSSDESDSGQPAVYSGSIKEQTMKLVVRLENDKEPLDTFVLTRGKDGRIRKCR